MSGQGHRPARPRGDLRAPSLAPPLDGVVAVRGTVGQAAAWLGRGIVGAHWPPGGAIPREADLRAGDTRDLLRMRAGPEPGAAREETTRAAGPGARAEIGRPIDGRARDGMGIRLISSEVPEPPALSDRIVSMATSGCRRASRGAARPRRRS